MALRMAVSICRSATIELKYMKTTVGWIAMKFGLDIYVPLRVNCNNFGDPSMFHVAPPLNLSNTLVYDQIHAEIMTHQPQLYFVFSANLQKLAC